jgi:hypothetical protein
LRVRCRAAVVWMAASQLHLLGKVVWAPATGEGGAKVFA